MLGFGKEKELVGLDIGSHSIKAVELRSKRKGSEEVFEVKKIGYEVLPRDAIVEGTIIDTEAVAEIINILFEENKISNRNVVFSVSGNSVIIKKIALPKMDEAELAETIIWEAKHSIPYPFEETNIDYCLIKPARRADDNTLEILLVAAKKDKISNYLNTLEQAQKNSKAIEIDVFALYNVVEINYPEAFWDKNLAIVNLGAGTANLVITERGIPQLFRDLSLGGSLIIENLAKEMNISLDDAEKALKGLPVATLIPDQYQPVIEAGIQNILEEIHKTFALYETGQRGGRTIELILLSGGLSKLRGLNARFEERFKVKTEVLYPFRKIILDTRKFRDFYPEEMAADFGVAAGLATRRAGE